MKKIKNNKNGVSYDGYETDGHLEATICFGEKRVVIAGKLALENMSGSWKFGKQIQIVLWGNNVKVEQRADNSGFSRVEIAIPYEEGKKLFEAFSNNTLTKEEGQSSLDSFDNKPVKMARTYD